MHHQSTDWVLSCSDMKSDHQIGAFEGSCCPLLASLWNCNAGIEKPPCSPVLHPPPRPRPPLSCMVQCDRQMCGKCRWSLCKVLGHFNRNDSQKARSVDEGKVHSPWWHSELFLKDGLQWCCFYHTQDFFIVIKGAGARQGEVGEEGVSSYPASCHISHFHFLNNQSICHSSSLYFSRTMMVLTSAPDQAIFY